MIPRWFSLRSLALAIGILLPMPIVLHASPPPDPDAEAKARSILHGVHRIVILGDSITQAGDYVVDVECWLLAHKISVEVLDLGLSSETVTDLTLEENSDHLQKHKFGRPFVSERLTRVLEATKPDLIIACYGMNDGSSLPAGEAGLKRFSAAVEWLRNSATKAGVQRIIFCTPPIHDNKGQPAADPHEKNLTDFSSWLLTKKADGWDVVDIHTPMRKALDTLRAKDPIFRFANDGVHPDRAGHWLMASEILKQVFGANLTGVTSAEDLFSANGAEIRKQVKERMAILFAAWMSQIGHKRPGVPGCPGSKPGSTVEQANATASELTKKIHAEVGIAP